MGCPTRYIMHPFLPARMAPFPSPVPPAYSKDSQTRGEVPLHSLLLGHVWSKVPSARPQEVQVKTSGRALAGAGRRDRFVHLPAG